ncbi:hypothetical protein WJX81_006409 [Elliptochloris bilobata]|uniref:Uncharacterized protein n=1 Tax=Elliptochloris bilobata TaxID=381761 RepID=A0AAW1SIX7_9CHLO
MVRQAQLAAYCIPGLPVQDMHVVTADPETMALYHKVVHQSKQVQIEPWQTEHSAEGYHRRRTVTYTQPIRGPEWFRRLCGYANMRFMDAHEATYSAAADTLTFDFKCFLRLPTGRLTTASVRWVQAPMARGGPVGVQVDTSMHVAQEGFKYMGLQTAMESLFLSEAEHGVQRFNALAALLVHERGLGLPDNLAWATALLGEQYAAFKLI